MKDITIFEGLGISLLGISIVFIMLILLMIVIILMSKILSPKARMKSEAAPEPVAAVPGPAASKAPTAPGSVGELKLYNVPDKTAALLMAIVADQMQVPLNQLRFKSIKDISE